MRLLDIELLKLQYFDRESINLAIRAAEIEFSHVDFAVLEKNLVNKGWSLDYIYLDQKKNRYSIENYADQS